MADDEEDTGDTGGGGGSRSSTTRGRTPHRLRRTNRPSGWAIVGLLENSLRSWYVSNIIQITFLGARGMFDKAPMYSFVCSLAR